MGNEVSGGVRSCVGPSQEEIQKLKGLEAKISTKATKIEELTKAVEDHKETEKEKEERVKTIIYQKQKLQGEIELLKKQHEEAISQLTGEHDNVLKAVRNQLDKKHEEIENLKGSLKDVEDTIDVLQEEKQAVIQKGQADVAEQVQKRNVLNEEIQTLNKKLSAAQDVIQSKQQELDEVERRKEEDRRLRDEALAQKRQLEDVAAKRRKNEAAKQVVQVNDDDVKDAERDVLDKDALPEGTLRELMLVSVTVQNATNVSSLDLPRYKTFCQVHLGANTKRAQRTKVKKGDPNPYWNDTLGFLTDRLPATGTVTLWNKEERKEDGTVKVVDVELGKASFNLPKTKTGPDNGTQYKFTLEKTSIAISVTISVSLVPQLALIWKKGWDGITLLEMIKASGADFNAPERNGKTPLMNAIAREQAMVARYLLASGVDTNVTDVDDRLSALHFTAIYDNVDTCKSLIGNGSINPDTLDAAKRTALMYAAKNGHMEVANVLLTANADVSLADLDGLTALMHAVFEGHTNVAELLLKSRADPNAKNANGLDALGITALKNQAATTQLLLKYGADPQAQDVNGMSALMIASIRGNVDVVKVLVTASVSIDQTDAQGRTALMLASSRADAVLCKLLVEKGANINLSSKDNETPLTFAQRANAPKLVKKLRKWYKQQQEQ